jgi:hypothetical protein
MLIVIKTKLQLFFLTRSVGVDLHYSRSETQRTYFCILLVAIKFSTIEASVTYGHVMAAFDIWCHQNYLF